MKEVWKEIPDCNGRYFISNKGRLKIITCTNKKKIRTHFSKAGLGGGYYHCRVLTSKGYKSSYIHRLVAVAFIPNPKNKPTVNHKDLNKTNNYATNLEWTTQKENLDHYWDINNRKMSLERKSKYRHTNGKTGLKITMQYSKEGILLNIFPSRTEASLKTGILISHIVGCCIGRHPHAKGYIFTNFT